MARTITILVVLAVAQLICQGGEGRNFVRRLKAAPAKVILRNSASAAPDAVKIERVWKGDACHTRLRNTASAALRVARVDLFDLEHGLPPDTLIYAEASQMLGQTGGTLARPEDWGSYADRLHYKLDEPEGLRTGHGMLLLQLEW